jgi:hypothetical protein
LLHSYFQVSPARLDGVQVWALAGPLNDIQRRVPKPLLRCLGCVLRVVVQSEGEPSSRFSPDVTLGIQAEEFNLGFRVL